jgi:trehalose 6-phosphate phosphatase
MGERPRPSATISPLEFDAVIFDMDGVVTDTAKVHLAAWRRMFDEYLRQVSELEGEPFVPFTDEEYLRYVDGRSRTDGARALLESRGVYLENGDPGDPPGEKTIWGLSARKNHLFLETLLEEGADAYESTLNLLADLRASGIRTALITASRNCAKVLASAGVEGVFDAQVDGIVAADLRLAGKPAPDVFLEAARRLGVPPARAVVVEDAQAGVEAGRNGGFALVIGVDRGGQADELAAHGAHVVVEDLGEVRVV